MSSKKQVRVFLRDRRELLQEPTAKAVQVLSVQFPELNPKTLERYFQEFRKGEEIVASTSPVSQKDAVFNILELHPEIVGLPTSDAREEIRTLLPSCRVADSTLSRYVQAYRKSMEMDSNIDPDGDYWYRFDEDSSTYTICAGKAQWAGIPAHEVQDWIQTYTYMGGRKSQSAIARRACIQGRPLTRKQVRGIFKALNVTKDSLPIAPHIVEGSVDDAADRVWEARLAAVESKSRYEEADRWRKEYEKLHKKYSNLENLAERIVDSVLESEPLDLPPLTFDSKVGEYEACLFLSDWHVGQSFDSPLGSFNRDVFLSRVHALASEIHLHLDTTSRPLRKLSIAIGGDMVDGVLEMRTGHRLEQDVWGGQQVSDAATALSWLIESLWARLDCPVQVYSVGGNHDRAGGSRDYDPTRVIAQWLYQLTSEKLPDEIEWVHETSEVCQWRIGNTQMLLSHGDHTPKDPKKLGDIYTLPGCLNTMILTGHRHTPNYSEHNHTTHVQSGSMVGPDPYGGNRFGSVSRPSQIWIELPEGKRPRTTVLPIE